MSSEITITSRKEYEELAEALQVILNSNTTIFTLEEILDYGQVIIAVIDYEKNHNIAQTLDHKLLDMQSPTISSQEDYEIFTHITVALLTQDKLPDFYRLVHAGYLTIAINAYSKRHNTVPIEHSNAFYNATPVSIDSPQMYANHAHKMTDLLTAGKVHTLDEFLQYSQTAIAIKDYENTHGITPTVSDLLFQHITPKPIASHEDYTHLSDILVRQFKSGIRWLTKEKLAQLSYDIKAIQHYETTHTITLTLSERIAQPFGPITSLEEYEIEAQLVVDVTSGECDSLHNLNGPRTYLETVCAVNSYEKAHNIKNTAGTRAWKIITDKGYFDNDFFGLSGVHRKLMQWCRGKAA